MTIVKSMLTVKSVGDQVVRVKLIQDPVSVVLHCCSEDYQFVVLRHFFEEFPCAWSDQKSSNLRFCLRVIAYTLDIVDECFI